MKSLMIRKILLACLTVLVALPAMAQEDALKDLPGYVDFGELHSVFGEPAVQISVGASLLGLVSSLSAEEDPETAALFKRLKGVRVNVFETETIVDGAVGLIKDVSSKLNKLGCTDVRRPIPTDLTPEAPAWIFNLAAVHREPGHEAIEYFDTNLAGAREVIAMPRRWAARTCISPAASRSMAPPTGRPMKPRRSARCRPMAPPNTPPS